MNRHNLTAARPNFAVANYIFGPLMPEHLAIVAKAGFPGIELYRNLMLDYLEDPRALKMLVDRHGLTVCTISNGGVDMACDFIDPARRRQTIADHVAFVRDVLSVFGCRHFKMNMGARPKGGPTDAQLQHIADALNELGCATATLGVKLAPHPHIWGPVERPHEVQRIMELTDPAYVSLTPDTAHLNLGGGDPLALIERYYERVAAIHWKDTKAAYRGFTGPTPTQEEHRREILYRDLGAGGVDLPRLWQFLQARGYAGWITIDLDPPRANEGEGSAEEKLLLNRRYLLETLQVGSLAASGPAPETLA